MRTALLWCLSLGACASIYRPPETIQAKMARFQPKRQHFPVPQIQLSPLAPSRGPASRPRQVGKKAKTPAAPNKSLYFLTLLEQYQAFLPYSRQEREGPASCPSFHNIWVDRPKADVRQSWPVDYGKGGTLSELSHPELSLPLQEDSMRPVVADRLEGADPATLVGRALEVHIDKVDRELRELCDSGSSENYYAWENLMNHIRKKSFAASTKNLRSLFKTTLFVNQALLKSLSRHRPEDGRKPASMEGIIAGQNFDRMTRKAGVSWAQEYLETLR